MEDVIGKLFEDAGEVSGEWRIPNFLSLREEVDKFYRSPAFFFLDSCWCLRIYPNGNTKSKTEEWVGIFLERLDCGLPVTVNYSIVARIADKERKYECAETTYYIGGVWGIPKFLKRSDLQSGERAASPSDTLILSYSVKSGEQKPSENTLCHRLWSTSFRWNDTLRTQDRNYVVLNLKNGNIWAHKAILESSSPVFSRMLTADMRESETGEVNIADATRSVFEVVVDVTPSGD